MIAYYDRSGNPVDTAIGVRLFADNRVAHDQIGDVAVSTIHLVIDHGHGSTDRPILFETMVFGGPLDQECERYCTQDEALAGHRAMVTRVRGES